MGDSDLPDVPAFSVRKRQDDTWLTGERLAQLQDEIRQVYLSDSRPWVIGFSGGKDSTAALQLIWYSIAKLPKEQRQKRIYVIASDTLVETPVIVGHITRALQRINEVSATHGLPFSADLVRPKVTDTFWVNMIGRGYPAPYRRFRWCTDRLKIQPANVFIEKQVVQHGEVVLVLGVRRDESATRAQVMALHRKPGERLSRHSSLRSAWVYTPVEHFTTNDVWTYLLSAPNPWGSNNRDLVTLYRNAQAGECPLVVDTTTPSCGGGRFGCWTCTVVERDKSMEAMIESGEEWMEPLLEVRNWLSKTSEPTTKHRYREMQRRNGKIQIWGEEDNKKLVWGPYKLDIRREILRRVLAAQTLVRKNGPDPSVFLITDDELQEIRRLWRTEEGDWEDSLPKIYREEVGADLDWVMDDTITSSALEASVLTEVCAEAGLPLVMLRELIDYERELQGLGRRQGVYEKIDSILSKDWRPREQVFSEMNYKPENELDEDVEAEDAP